MAEYRKGETLRIALDARVTQDTATTPGWLYVRTDSGVHLQLPVSTDPSGDGMDVTRLAPAEGMPQDGELWESSDGTRVVVHVDHRGRMSLVGGIGTFSLAEVLERGRLTPIWQHPRPEPEPEQVVDGLGPVRAVAMVPDASMVTSPLWCDGRPVRLLNVECADTEGLLWVKYQYGDDTPITATVSETFRVTLVELEAAALREALRESGKEFPPVDEPETTPTPLTEVPSGALITSYLIEEGWPVRLVSVRVCGDHLHVSHRERNGSGVLAHTRVPAGARATIHMDGDQ